MIKKTLLALSIVALGCTGAVAQQGGIKRTPLQKAEFPDGYVTVTGIAEVPAGGSAGRHTHPGIDLAVIGPGDLATSINKRGLPDDPEVLALMKRAEEGILKSGVPIGGVARTAEQANAMIDRGYLALALGFDWSLFQRGIAASFAGIKR